MNDQRFARFLAENVRDRSIEHAHGVVRGEACAASLQKFAHVLDGCSEDRRQLIEDLLVETVDATIFNFLFMFEEAEEDVKLLYRDGTDTLVDAAEKSDGLHGEIFGAHGWFATYSAYGESR